MTADTVLTAIHATWFVTGLIFGWIDLPDLSVTW